MPTLPAYSDSKGTGLIESAQAMNVQDGNTETPAPASNLEAILNIPVSVQVVLGGATMPVSSLMKLGRGAVVPLDHRVGEPVDVVVNGHVVARGEMIVLEGDSSRLGVSLIEIVGQGGPKLKG